MLCSMIMYLREKLKGAIISLPTPTTRNYEIDYGKFKEHVCWLIDSGLVEDKAVLMGAGGYGEGYFLTREEHGKIMESLVDAVDGKVPTMTGIFQSNTREAIKRAKMAEDAGIDFSLVFPPRYNRPVDNEVFTHYKMINDATDIGIVLYNTPWSAMNYEIGSDLVERLVTLDNIVGAKWTSNDLVNFVTVIKQFSNRLNIINNNTAVSLGYKLGAKGFISLHGNIAPKTILHLIKLLENREYDKFDAEYARTHAWRGLFRRGEIDCTGVGEGTTCKALMDAAGRTMGPPMPPQKKLSKKEIEKIRKCLVEIE